jgi:hypothetical protein
MLVAQCICKMHCVLLLLVPDPVTCAHFFWLEYGSTSLLTRRLSKLCCRLHELLKPPFLGPPQRMKRLQRVDDPSRTIFILLSATQTSHSLHRQIKIVLFPSAATLAPISTISIKLSFFYFSPPLVFGISKLRCYLQARNRFIPPFVHILPSSGLSALLSSALHCICTHLYFSCPIALPSLSNQLVSSSCGRNANSSRTALLSCCRLCGETRRA